MKNKIFFQLNPFWQIACLFCLGIVVIGSYSIISVCVNNFFEFDFINLIPIAIASLSVLFCLYTFIRFEHLNIIFKDQFFYIPDDWMWKRDKIQFKTVVEYSQIIDIKLIRSPFNSKGKRIESSLPSSGVLKPYIEIISKNDKKKRICVMYFTKSQRIKIIDEIKIRMVKCGNNSPIGNSKDIVKALPKGGVII